MSSLYEQEILEQPNALSRLVDAYFSGRLDQWDEVEHVYREHRCEPLVRDRAKEGFDR